MKVNNKHYRSIWYEKDTNTVKIIDQRELPYSFKVIDLDSLEDFRIAIKDMAVRGAPLIGATAAYALYLASKEKEDIQNLQIFISI